MPSEAEVCPMVRSFGKSWINTILLFIISIQLAAFSASCEREAEMFEEALKLVAKDNDSERQAAATALCIHGKIEYPHLIEALKDRNDFVRKTAIESCKEYGDERAVHALLCGAIWGQSPHLSILRSALAF